nr:MULTISPECIES: YdaS family helix-turn-helix protein [unclassified Janthinobacterium]
MDKLHRYLNSLTKHDRASFFARVGTSEGYLRKAISIQQKLGEGLCIKIERESSRAVRCEDLRRDVDWEYLRAGVPSAPGND